MCVYICHRHTKNKRKKWTEKKHGKTFWHFHSRFVRENSNGLRHTALHLFIYSNSLSLFLKMLDLPDEGKRWWKRRKKNIQQHFIEFCTLNQHCNVKCDVSVCALNRNAPITQVGFLNEMKKKHVKLKRSATATATATAVAATNS